MGVHARGTSVRFPAVSRRLARGTPFARGSGMARLRSLLLLSGFALFASMSVACTRVNVEDVRGPGGADWKLLTCSRLDKKCFRVAEKMCPSWYYFARADGTKDVRPPGSVTKLPPQEQWSSGMYSRKRGKLFVRCAEAGAPTSM